MAEFNWGDFLSLAQEIETGRLAAASPDLQQAAIRTAINRSYYAAFHKAKDYAENKTGETFSRGGVHELVVGFYRQNWKPYLDDSYRSNCGVIRDILIRMKRARGKADYNCKSVLDKTVSMTKAITDARLVIEEITKLPK